MFNLLAIVSIAARFYGSALALKIITAAGLPTTAAERELRDHFADLAEAMGYRVEANLGDAVRRARFEPDALPGAMFSEREIA